MASGNLSPRQRRLLSGLAQSLGCSISLGRAGATAELASRLAELLEEHELVKLRFGDLKDSRRELAEDLAERTGSELVRLIGFVAIFWKRAGDPARRKIDIGN
jgi:RNA-binding protein